MGQTDDDVQMRDDVVQCLQYWRIRGCTFMCERTSYQTNRPFLTSDVHDLFHETALSLRVLLREFAVLGGQVLECCGCEEYATLQGTKLNPFSSIVM